MPEVQFTSKVSLNLLYVGLKMKPLMCAVIASLLSSYTSSKMYVFCHTCHPMSVTYCTAGLLHEYYTVTTKMLSWLADFVKTTLLNHMALEKKTIGTDVG